MCQKAAIALAHQGPQDLAALAVMEATASMDGAYLHLDRNESVTTVLRAGEPAMRHLTAVRSCPLQTQVEGVEGQLKLAQLIELQP